MNKNQQWLNTYSICPLFLLRKNNLKSENKKIWNLKKKIWNLEKKSIKRKIWNLKKKKKFDINDAVVVCLNALIVIVIFRRRRLTWSRPRPCGRRWAWAGTIRSTTTSSITTTTNHRCSPTWARRAPPTWTATSRTSSSRVPCYASATHPQCLTRKISEICTQGKIMNFGIIVKPLIVNTLEMWTSNVNTSNFRIMKRPQTCEHPLMWTLLLWS